MLRLNFPPRCRSSGTGWKLARVRCVAASNTSLKHLFCKSVVIAQPKGQFLISSITGEVKKKHNCIDRSFCCFPAHVTDLFGWDEHKLSALLLVLAPLSGSDCWFQCLCWSILDRHTRPITTVQQPPSAGVIEHRRRCRT